jgi:endonuclease/exonuclease/phosphatase family metal-dependent hydrolase
MRFLPLLILLFGCPSETPEPAEPLTFATYNLGLAVGFVPGANERAAAATTATLDLDADVVCVQEVWEAEHVALLEGQEGWPHTVFPAPQQEVGPEPACVGGDEVNLIECMEQDCADTCLDELPGCLLDNCSFDFLGLEDDCNRCIQANVGATATEIQDICTAETTEYSYGGSFGTGILSKHPITSSDELVVPSTTSRRSVLHAVIDAPDGPLDVYCTHLTAVFSLIPYPRPEGSWSEEQATQIAMLRTLTEDASSDRIVVMGDMNTGLASEIVDAEVPENYEVLSEGFINPFRQEDGRCTFCPENLISSVDSDATGRLIDHVLSRGFDGTPSTDRLFDDRVDIETCGDTVPGALSDHYGVEVTFAPVSDDD